MIRKRGTAVKREVVWIREPIRLSAPLFMNLLTLKLGHRAAMSPPAQQRAEWLRR